jgi:hypothetical protein
MPRSGLVETMMASLGKVKICIALKLGYLLSIKRVDSR